jgi:hypothetical protein
MRSQFPPKCAADTIVTTTLHDQEVESIILVTIRSTIVTHIMVVSELDFSAFCKSVNRDMDQEINLNIEIR